MLSGGIYVYSVVEQFFLLTSGIHSEAVDCFLGKKIAESLHAVAGTNPAYMVVYDRACLLAQLFLCLLNHLCKSGVRYIQHLLATVLAYAQ